MVGNLGVPFSWGCTLGWGNGRVSEGKTPEGPQDFAVLGLGDHPSRATTWSFFRKRGGCRTAGWLPLRGTVDTSSASRPGPHGLVTVKECPRPGVAPAFGLTHLFPPK